MNKNNYYWIFSIFFILSVYVISFFYYGYKDSLPRDKKKLEMLSMAIPSSSHPMSGVWRDEEDCNSVDWGLVVIPNENNYLFVFCGYESCSENGRIIEKKDLFSGDKYRVINKNQIKVFSSFFGDWNTFYRCGS